MSNKQGVYLPSGNDFEIDHRLASYNYEYSISAMRTYMFDNALACTFISTVNLKKKMSLKQLFPEDLVNFFESLLRNAFTKQQMVHAKINGHHMLFSANTYQDHVGTTIGVIMHEIPFTRVQKLPGLKPTEMSMVHFKTSVEGGVFGVGPVFSKHPYPISLRTIHSCKNIGNVTTHPQNLFDIIESKKIANIYRKLTHHVADKDVPPIRYCWYHGNLSSELKMMMTLSKFSNTKTYVLISVETLQDVDVDEYMYDFANFPRHYEHPDKVPWSVCAFCNRIYCKLFDHEDEQYFLNNVLYYNETLPPVIDKTVQIPLFGRNGMTGKQSYKLIDSSKTIKHAWLNASEWNRYKLKHFVDPITASVKYDLCELCEDEWENYFQITGIADPGVE